MRKTIYRCLTTLGRKRAFFLVASSCTLALAVLTNATIVAHTAVSAQDVTSSNLHRLNEAQYARSIDQAFGAGIKIPGRFDPPLRKDGLMAIGDGIVTVSASGFEQYELRAREIASQVLASDRQPSVVPCALTPTSAYDAACATTFFVKYGRLLYRRPLTPSELSETLRLVQAVSQKSGKFRDALEIGLARLLMSPNFIFRLQTSEADPVHPGEQRLNGYSLATRISFLLWDAPPDAALLDAAAAGDLHDPAKLAKQVDRLMADARFEQGMRSFFSDMLGYEQFNGLSKDQAIYPKFTSQMARDAQEQALRTIVDLLVTNKGDYRDLFTTRKTFMNRNMGALYKVPVEAAGLDSWVPYEFPKTSARSGILTFAAFLLLDPTHEGRSSPTIRGKSVREFLLCQHVPQPPANVNFAIVQDVHNPEYRTARQRLTAHRDNPACAGCHALTDPIGLSLENFDASGDVRTHENDALIDATGKFDGKPYTGAIELSNLLHDSPAVPACLVQRSFEYGAGRPVSQADQPTLERTGEAFAKSGYRLSDLMRMIATSRDFAITSAPAATKTSIVASR